MQINYMSIETIKFSKLKMFGFEVSGFPDVAASFFAQCRQKSEMERKREQDVINSYKISGIAEKEQKEI